MNTGPEQSNDSLRGSANLLEVVDYLSQNGFEIRKRFDEKINEIVDITGREFLSLGERLKSYYYTSKELVNISKDGAINSSEKVIGDIIGNMQLLLSSITNTLKVFDANVNSQHGYLKEISTHIDEIIGELHGTKKIVKYLRMLAISTKIENSRLSDGKNDFNILADNVEKLSIVISDKSINLNATSAALLNAIKDTLSKTDTIQREHVKQENDIFGDINKTLLLLTDKYNVCFTKVTEINEISGRIYKTTGEVVSSIQIQDIARQQLEHIADAIEGIQKLSASLNDQNEEQKLTDITIINQICRVQMAQLENSGEQLASALNHIEDGLSTLKGEIQSIYITSSSLGIEDKREESYINTITRGLDVVNKELQVNSGLRNNFYKSVKQITDTVVALTNLIEEIEDVGNEIELISLNSRIKASQSGREGAALDVLAESIQGLSNDAKDLTGKIREYVNAINCSAAELMKYNSTDQDKHDNESEGLNNIMNNLQQFESDSASLFNNLTEKVNSLNEETNDSVLFGSVKEILKLNIYKMIEQLEDIITYTAPFCKESSEMKDDLEQLKNKYTMDSERSIHDRLLNGEDISVDNSDDLGDNIELF